MSDQCRSQAPHAGHEWVPVGSGPTLNTLWCDGVPEPPRKDLYADASRRTLAAIRVSTERNARRALAEGRADEAAALLSTPLVERAFREEG